jgi:hypothetical protein
MCSAGPSLNTTSSKVMSPASKLLAIAGCSNVRPASLATLSWPALELKIGRPMFAASTARSTPGADVS